MADYRDMAAALGGGYGQDTGGITPDTLITLKNGKKASASDLLGMLKAIGSGSLSNLESLVRGGVAQIPGTVGDLEGLARMGINKAFGAGGVNVSETPELPTTTDILGMMPRVTATRPETTGIEELGGYMSPATAKLAGKAIKATEGLPVGMSIRSVTAPQETALALAQQRAALPVEQGGLGLPANNTAADRAKAMGGKDMVHFSRTGGDYTTLDSGQYAIAPFDAVGTHVGSPQAAMERFQNTVGYKVNNPNYANDKLTGATYPVTILGDRPLMNQNGMPWGEDDLNAFLRKEGGHNWSDVNGGKMTYQDMNAALRKKLFEEQGYTSIPYFNEVEGKGSISYIVPPENIRSRFAAFDPFRKDVATATAMGVALPDLLAAEKEDKQKKLSKALTK
jgi:hypothetical protein